MGKVLDTFEFPHGGRKGIDIDFTPWLDGQIHQLERGVDWEMETTADSFLGALSRAANSKGLRVNKHVSEDKNVVTIRARPKKEKPVKDEADKTPAASGSRSRSK